MSTYKVVVIPGDGIGPEITKAVQCVIAAAGVDIDWIERRAGMAALEREGEVLPASTIEAVLEHHVGIKGPCTTPVGKGFSSVNVQLRKQLDLYAAVRPVRNLPGVKTRFDNVDLVIVRENTEGLYSGIENVVTEGVVTSLKVATEKACTRIARWAFNYIVSRDRHKLSVFHKANIMKLTDGMFIDCSRRVWETEFPHLEYEEVIIDAGCMKMVQDPTRFDVLLLENLYGDVVSDLCAGLVGGLGVVPGANIGEKNAIFEAVHGSAPDIAGKKMANPLALLMSAVMMLNHIATNNADASVSEAAERIKSAYNKALEDDCKTADLGGRLKTQEFADAIIERL